MFAVSLTGGNAQSSPEAALECWVAGLAPGLPIVALPGWGTGREAAGHLTILGHLLPLLTTEPPGIQEQLLPLRKLATACYASNWDWEVRAVRRPASTKTASAIP